MSPCSLDLHSFSHTGGRAQQHITFVSTIPCLPFRPEKLGAAAITKDSLKREGNGGNLISSALISFSKGPDYRVFHQGRVKLEEHVDGQRCSAIHSPGRDSLFRHRGHCPSLLDSRADSPTARVSEGISPSAIRNTDEGIDGR